MYTCMMSSSRRHYTHSSLLACVQLAREFYMNAAVAAQSLQRLFFCRRVASEPAKEHGEIAPAAVLCCCTSKTISARCGLTTDYAAHPASVRCCCCSVLSAKRRRLQINLHNDNDGCVANRKWEMCPEMAESR